MTIQDLVSKFTTTPFLFVGSGFSRRYYNLPDWNGLLKEFINRLSPDEFAFQKYVKQAQQQIKKDEDLLPQIAEILMKDFDTRWYTDPSFRQLDEKHLSFVRDGQSPFKVEIAQYIKQKSISVDHKQDELALFKKISSKSFAGIITTNYDCLLENETDEYTTYIGQEELLFSAIQGWAEIYKIHGSITNPESIVITASDYAHFQEYCAYLAAKLMTIFMEYPIIFFGYSLNDPNVRIILQSIAKCLSAENLEKLQDRFIYVEWIAEKNDIEISDAAITMGDKTVRMTNIKTDNFIAVYEALAQKRTSLPAKVLRLFKQEFYTYALTSQPTAMIRVADIEDTRVGDEELILAIGKPSDFNLRGLKGLTAKEWYRHIVLHDLEFTADEILEYAYPPLMSTNNTLPLNMLLREATKVFPECNEKAKRTFDDNLSSTIRNQRARRKIPNRSVKGILSDNSHNINKAMDNIAYLYENEINCDDLEAFLKKSFEDACFYDNLSRSECSNFKRLVRIYDCLKYSNWPKSLG